MVWWAEQLAKHTENEAFRNIYINESVHMHEREKEKDSEV